MKKWMFGLLAVVIVAAGGWYLYQNWWLPQQVAAQQPTYSTIPVARGEIAATVNATGNFAPQAEVSLSFRNPGRVQTVHVIDGETVQQGQLLAELETTDLTLALAQAQVSRDIASAQLAKLETPPDEKDVLAAQAAIEVAQAGVAGAEASLNAARANYSQLFVAVSADQQQVNEASLRQAEVNLRTAQSAYNQVKDQANIGELPQSAQLESSTLAYELARAQAALTDQSPTNAATSSGLNQIAQAELQLRQAQANLITAQNNLATLLEGPSAEDLEIARAQVQQAQISALQSENSLANAQLVAPITGVVSTISVKQGELYSGGAAVVMSDLDRYEMDVLVDEIDVRNVEVGQAVQIRVDAFPDQDLQGTVSEIGTTASNVAGVIAYSVTVVPDATELPLRAGMSATTIITTANVPDAVLVPNRYITLNRDTGAALVYKMVNGAPVPQSITLGLRNETESQVLSGVDVGDTLVLVTSTGVDALLDAFRGN